MPAMIIFHADRVISYASDHKGISRPDSETDHIFTNADDIAASDIPSTAMLLALYNFLSDSKVARFATRKAGAQRLLKLIEVGKLSGEFGPMSDEEEVAAPPPVPTDGKTLARQAKDKAAAEKKAEKLATKVAAAADKKAAKVAPKVAKVAAEAKPTWSPEEIQAAVDDFVNRPTGFRLPLNVQLFPKGRALISNPRRPDSHGYRALALVIAKPGLTMAEYLKSGGAGSHLRWDVEKGNIRLAMPEAPAAE